MPLLGRQQRAPTVPGRAVVVPGSTGHLAGDGDPGQPDHLTAKSLVRSSTLLIGESAEDGRPVSHERQRVKCTLPGWLRFVMSDAGTGDDLAERLPAEIHVPVHIDQATRRIVAVDVAAAESELGAYRSVGTREWNLDEATAAPVAGAPAPSAPHRT